MPEQYKSATELDRAPVIEPGHTFGTVTEKISAIVLTRPASNGWFLGFGIAFMLTMMMLFAIGYLFLKGIGIWGVHHPHRMGLCHRQLRLVDRHRPRRHPDLRHPLITAPVVAQFHQPFR